MENNEQNLELIKEPKIKGRKPKSEVSFIINNIVSESQVLVDNEIIPDKKRETVLNFFSIKSSYHNWYTFGIPKRVITAKILLTLINKQNKRIKELEQKVRGFIKNIY